MPFEGFTINGHIIDRRTERGVLGLDVQLWAASPQGNVCLKEATTGDEGAFQMSLSAADLRRLAGRTVTAASFRVHREDRLIHTETFQPADIPVDAAEWEVEIRVSLPEEPAPGSPPGEPDEFVVQGTVRYADGRAFAGGLVRAYEKDLRDKEKEPLGESETDAQGRYQIRYRLRRAEKGTTNLLLRAFSRDGQEVARSSILFDAGTEETIDLVVGNELYRGPSEYEQLVNDLTPLLQGLSFAELTEDEDHQDVSFLSSSTGQDPLHIAFLIKAHRLMQKTDVPAEVFYGLFRSGLPTALPALLAQSPDLQRRALARSAASNVIPAHFAEQADAVLDQFKRLIVKQAFEQPVEEGKTRLPDLLSTVLADAKQQEAFLAAYVAHAGPMEDFWRDLQARPAFQDKVADLQFTLQLSLFTGNHLPLVRALQHLKAEGEITTLSDLARQDWLALLNPQNGDPLGHPPDVPGTGDKEKLSNYAQAMTHMAEDAFPTAFITGRLKNDTLDGKDTLLAFFQANQGFDIKTTRLESYLAENPAALAGIAEEQRETLKQQVRRMQRLYRLAPRYTQTSALMKGGLNSAYAISRMGKTAFALQYGKELGGQAQADLIYERAQQTAATAMTLLFEYGVPSMKTPTAAVPEATFEQVEGIPDWPSLFGSLDLCQCAHCRSVYSPAAYLVDILHFLQDRQLVDVSRGEQDQITAITYKGKSAKDILFERRPDLGEIELTCENTNTPVPYVDLVNEILEEFAAPFAAFPPFTLDAARENDLDTRTLSPELCTAFAPPLSEQAVITVKKKGAWWTIDDLPFTYTILKESGQPQVTMRGRQTSGTLEERRANPQYINPRAYDKLRQQVFPWQLPFDLWAEEARTYLDHLGVRRHALMEAFLPGERAALLDDVVIAREYLDLTTAEANLITGTTAGQSGAASPGVWNLWGFDKGRLDPDHAIPDPADSTKWITKGYWYSVLAGRVDVFLQQSGLAYKDLLDLLDTDSINPVQPTGERTITIQSADDGAPDTCELEKLKLEGLDRATAIKIAHSLRLWRKLGWHLYDLDQASAALKPSDLNDTFLTQLSHVKRLHERLNVPVERLLAFWAPIDATVYIDHHVEDQPPVPSLYTRLFRNKTVINPPDPAFTEDPAGLTGKLSECEGSVASALGLSVEDLSLLIDDAGVIPRKRANLSQPRDQLSLDSLSRLFRHATLAGALALRVRDYLSVLALYGGDPFASPRDTVLFTEHVDQICSSGFSIDDLDYLLRHTPAAKTEVAPTDAAMALVLGDIRAGLQTIAAENTFRDDPTDPNGPTTDLNGDLCRAKLALLNWDSALIDQVIGTFNDALTYRKDLAALPEGLAFPAGLQEKISFDKAAGSLAFSGNITVGERDSLLILAGDPADPNHDAYEDAVRALFDAPRRFARRNLRTFSVPDFSKPLKAKPDGVVFPAALTGKVYFDAMAGMLHFQGSMTEAERKMLLDLSSEPNYQAAVYLLFAAPDTHVPQPDDAFLTENDVNALFDDPTTPAARFERLLKKLLPHLRMTLSRRLVIQKVSETLQLETEAAEKLLTTWVDWPSRAGQRVIEAFLAAIDPENDVDTLPDNPTTPAARFERLLKKLLPHLRTAHSLRLVIQKASEKLQLETEAAEKLLTTLIDWPSHAGEKVIEAFLAAPFAESDPNLSVDRSAFADQFDAYTLLHKIALVTTTLDLTPKQLGWLFSYGPAAGWPDPNQLPLEASDPASTVLPAWEQLWRLCQVRDSLPLGEDLLDQWFGLAYSVPTGASDAKKNAAKAETIELLQTRLGWTVDNLEALVGDGEDHTSTGLLHAAFPGDFLSERLLWRLLGCFSLLRRLGMSAAQCGALSSADVTQSVARDVRQAVRAKYDEAQWLELAQPLRDVLREKQRAALVAYLVAHPDTTHRWRDVNDVYAHFLIDVEMSPCQMTSRIKQAISSVQLFVQRCLMHLEPEVLASAEVDEKWREWQWMKNYRVWEANRKVFLYPENWIEPELRDDKTPFFAALESELMQSDLTQETAEEAFLAYLEQLDQVARLEIVGIHHQLEEDLTGHTAVDILHVFGRTYGRPHVYYYRQRVDGAYWTAWERVDLDIEGNHLIPVVWNRRLYLFWPIFTEKAKPIEGGTATVTQLHVADIASSKCWEIQLAWSERKQGKWTDKKVSSTCDNSIDIWQDCTDDPNTFFFRSLVGEQNNLFILVLQPFIMNYWEQVFGHPLVPAFRFDGCQADPAVTSAEECVTVQDSLESFMGRVTGTMHYRMFLREIDGRKLFLPAPTDTVALRKTPGTFLLLPHPDGASLTQHPFFYQDDTRTFLVIPSEISVYPDWWIDQNKVNPGIVGSIRPVYYEELEPSPIVFPADPMLFAPSFPVAPERRVVTPGVSGVVQPEGMVGPVVAGPGGAVRLRGILPWAARPSAAMGRASYAMTAGGNLGETTTTTAVASVAASILANVPAWTLVPVFSTENRYLFQTFYHPYVSAFVKELNRDGVDGLLQRKIQTDPDIFLPAPPSGPPPKPLDFKIAYDPHYPIVIEPRPKEDVDFTYGGGYALYNWELFFHAPLLIADRLSQNQRFEEAQQWFHYIFDPTDTSGLPAPQRYWRTKPFVKTTDIQYQAESIPNLLRYLADPNNEEWLADLDQEDREYLANYLESLPLMVDEWRKDPFNPHLIARLRTTAYQKTVVMKYIDNLIAWGDQLFCRDTMESINEATQLYILAAELLGKQPKEIPPRAIPTVHTYDTLEPLLDAFSNALVQIEEFVPPSAGSGTISCGLEPPLTLPTMLYFCAPPNSDLLEYWDTVADRLFKIRHCMNIEGVVRQLPLFAPPIEPGLLVKAAAAGVDISSALSDINAALPHYRFHVMAQKATELGAEVKSLGAALLAALEKQDAEELALLRAGHETALLKRLEQVKQSQLEEAEESLAALRKSRDMAVTRYLHYQKLLGAQSPQVPAEGESIPEQSPSPHVSIEEEGGTKLIPCERKELEKLKDANFRQELASGADMLAQIQFRFPIPKLAYWGMGVEFDTARAAAATASFFRGWSARLSYQGSRAARLAQYALRAHDWTLQSNLAAREIMQIDKQILGAEIRQAIAERELDNHRQQMEQSQEVEEFLRDNYTNQELYNWMVGQISGVYFQAYQLAYDVAKRAERAYRHELGLSDSSFIQFGYWDSLKKGLLAGELLYQDVKRMEVAYLEQNRREYELTKHISLALLNPWALSELKQTGTCEVELPEWLLDLDYPGHYMRRIKSVSLTIPCVTGPYTSVSCTLTLLRSSVRTAATLSNDEYGRRENGDDPRFRDSIGTVQSIATSSGQNDSGLFELNFHDERYLPFEGAGAISTWRLELPQDFRQFDYDTISDVVLHLRYTARDGGATLKEATTENLRTTFAAEGVPLQRLFSLRHEFPNEWYRFLRDAAGDAAAPTYEMSFEINTQSFPFVTQGRTIKVEKVRLCLLTETTPRIAGDAGPKFTLGPAIFESGQYTEAGELLWQEKDHSATLNADKPSETWKLTMSDVPGELKAEDGVSLDPDKLRNIALICTYSLS